MASVCGGCCSVIIVFPGKTKGVHRVQDNAYIGEFVIAFRTNIRGHINAALFFWC